MRFSGLLVATAATLVSANPTPSLAGGSITAGTDGTPLDQENLWQLDFKTDKMCWGDSDATLSSTKLASRCVTYSNGWNGEVDSIVFQYPNGDQNCKVRKKPPLTQDSWDILTRRAQYGCEKCKVNVSSFRTDSFALRHAQERLTARQVYYSPKGEKADCCDQHLVKRDWSQPDVGKCIDINPPKDSRVRYKVLCQ